MNGLAELMMRWRKRDETLDRGTWLGVREIAGRVRQPVKATRAELASLVEAGQIERMEFTNGIAWRGNPETRT